MEKYKKDLFCKSHNIVINSESLTEQDKILVENYIELILGKTIYEQTFFETLKDHLAHSVSFNSLESSQDIRKVFEHLGLSNETSVIIIWNYFDDVDKFNLQYLITYWEDIWFGESDEAICLFFPILEKIFLITHYNVVYY